VAAVWNLYGPTETTIWSTRQRVRDVDGQAVPIGRPVGNTQLYVLDAHGQPVPLGVVGELYIGGAGVARGYRNRPDLTAERFVPDPFSAQPGARLYCTGDLVRYRADGTLEFIGRSDHQIKLRGFRIELGEIETVLTQHPAVQQAVVVVREAQPGDTRLVAYVVPAATAPIADALRALLTTRLPAYMIPAVFVSLDALPLTPNGKIDRRALPAPDMVAPRETTPDVPPASPTEEQLAALWSALLRQPVIGRHDEFFALGGHSLLATQLVTRLRSLLGVELPLRAVFEAPILAGLASRIDALRAADPTLVAPPLVPVDRTQALPLSFAQQRLWFLDQLTPQSAAYNMSLARRLCGVLDLSALQQSVNTLVARHETLRTTFQRHGNDPVQVIAPPQPLPLLVIDLLDQPAAEREDVLRRQVAEMARRPFDLQQGPLLRVALLRVTANEHVLLLTLHHIITDGWSMGVLLRELSLLYTAQVSGQSAVLPPLPVQYADYALWQRQWVTGAVLDQQLAYWQHQLADAPVLELPSDRPRPAMPSHQGGLVHFMVDAEITNGLRQLSQAEGVTLFMTLLAAFQTLLSRYSGQTDILVGSPIAGRNRSELESLIGFFVNMLVLRTDLSGAPPVRQLLKRVRDVCLNAYAHQDLPFEQLVEELHPERSLSYNPLFQVGFALQNTPVAPLALPDLQMSSFNVASGTSTFDLSVFMREGPNGIAGRVEYNADLFDEATIERMIGHFRVLLTAIAADPDRSITTLPILTEPERETLLVSWNAPSAVVPPRWVHELFEAQARRDSAAPALIFEDIDGREIALTYDVLNRRANQLAHHLRSLGAGPGVRVGLCVERSLELVIGLLGILTAGAAYVPLDPEYPGERLSFMLQDAAAPILVTQQRLLAQLSAPSVDVVCLDHDSSIIAAWPDQNLGLALAPDTLAYVIYTSGSTGLPKGVMVEHQQLANTLSASQAAFAFTSGDRMPCIASFSFDIALFELFCPLLASGSAVLLTKQQILDLPGFARTLESITVLHTLPSLMRQIAGFIRDNDLQQRYSTMRQVFVGGDAVAPDLLAEIHDAFPQARINILYGPTEATIICATHPVQPEQILNKHLIGRPMRNSTLRLYDPHGQLVPIGVAGELYIGGASVTRGYLNRSDLTAEKFVELDDQRWYRTGDLARYLPDGTLEFLGRIDQQVKIRGFRIELGEIEAVLHEHPDVQEAVVLARSDLAGDPRLVGYVVPAPNSSSASRAQSSHVDDWQTLYDTTYGQSQPADPSFNITGWHSSYTGQPFPATEMRAWRDATVDRIRALRPQRIMEIGVGTGLLLFPLAEACATYHGVDFSAPALAHIRRHLPPAWTHVTLAQRRADEVADLPPGSIDTVILNSVVQYFPSVEYLVQVLSQAMRLLAPGGHIFVGDVRSRPLLEAFGTAVALAQAPLDTPRETLRQQARQQVLQERELLLDPGFFHALRHVFPRIGDVQVEIKRGRAHNELTQFRYDVTLTVDSPTFPVWSGVEYDWLDQRWTLADLQTALQAQQTDHVLVRQIPSTRIQPLLQAASLLHESTGPATAGELRAAIEILDQTGVDPESVWALGAALGYDVRIGWSGSGATGCYDAVFSRSGQARLPQLPMQPIEAWSAYATVPAAARVTAELAPRLRQYLRERLPEHMIPSAFLVLDALPLTPNGKLDRQALPVPETLARPGVSALIPPATPTEEELAALWQDLLGQAAVGRDDEFFALGGHSLLATQLVARVRATLGVELPLRAVFETPTLAGLAAQIDALREADPMMVTPLVPVNRDQALPLSFAQQRLWFLDQLTPQSAAYNVPLALRLHGALDVAAVQHSLDALVARHESLRTTFQLEGSDPVQVIAPPQPLPLTCIDLQDRPAAERDALVQAAVRQAASMPFDLQQGPLVRVALLRVAASEHVLLLSMHHSITDGWSVGVLLRELSQLYTAQVTGQPTTLPPLAVQYADYALWQRQWVTGAVLERQLAYWQQQLAGMPPLLELPTDRPRPAVPSHQGALQRFTVGAAVTAGLRALSQEAGVTLFMTLLGVWQGLLSRLSGQDDIAVGTSVANRTQAATEGIVGFFVNTLVLRTDLSGEPTLRDVLARVREGCLGAYAQQDVPFERVVEAVQPARALSHTPLFQVMFMLQNAPRADLQLPGVTVTGIGGSARQAKFDLTLTLTEHEDGLRGSLEYATDLFAADRIERMVAHFGTLLAAGVAQPDLPITTLPLLTAAERQQLLVEWNATQLPSPQDRCVHDLVTAQARRTPDAVAVRGGAESLTYAELHARATQLASYLRAQGVGRETVVGLCLDRSVELVVAVLAVWQAGAAYVPLDPTYPAERLAVMIADAGLALLLTQDSLRDVLPATALPVVCLDRDAPAIAATPPLPPMVSDGAQLAYVLYTSGSTGRPKGVQVAHRAVVNFLHTMQEAPGLDATDVLLSVTTLAFDISVLELVLPLTVGAQVVLVDRTVASDGVALGEALTASGATIMQATPATWRLLRDSGWAGRPELRVLSGGEALAPDLAAYLLPRVAAVWNLYGPTETTIWSTRQRVRDVDGQAVPIGRPVGNTQLYV
ncbi:MAG TPA: amino acid adenylation domain-containing protein, partial [Herpetosiphonaceae bacterium]